MTMPAGTGFQGNPDKNFTTRFADIKENLWYQITIQDAWVIDGQFGPNLNLSCKMGEGDSEGQIDYEFFIPMKLQIDSPYHRILCALFGKEKVVGDGVGRADWLGMEFQGQFKRYESRTGKIRFPLCKVKDSAGEACNLTGIK